MRFLAEKLDAKGVKRYISWGQYVTRNMKKRRDGQREMNED